MTLFSDIVQVDLSDTFLHNYKMLKQPTALIEMERQYTILVNTPWLTQFPWNLVGTNNFEKV